MIPIVRVLDSNKFEVLDHNGTSRVTIEDSWVKLTNLEPGAECRRAVVETQYGTAFMVWAKDQPKLKDLGDDLDDVLAEGKEE